MNMYECLRYRDPHAAIEFLTRAFGFEKHVVYTGDDGQVEHAEVAYRGGMVMIAGEKDDLFGPRAGQGFTYVVVADADAHHERAKAAGAEIVRPLEDQDYGSRDYSARDPEGNIWSFGTYDPARSETG